MAAPPPSPLDGNQVLQHSFEDATGRLRVEGIVSPAGGATEVIIDHTNDSIRLGDGTNFLTSTTVGSDIGLDVNIIGGSITINGVSTPAITNVAMALAATQYSHVISASSIRARLKVRGKSKLQVAYASGATGTTFITIYPGNSYVIDELDLSSALTVYFQASKAGEVLEIEEWS